jgi:hypothetical protein
MVIISTEVKYLFHDYVTHGEVHKPAIYYPFLCTTEKHPVDDYVTRVEVYGSTCGNYLDYFDALW